MIKQHDPDDRPALDVLEGMLETIRTAATNPGWFTGGERGARFYLIDALARAERATRRLRAEQAARDDKPLPALRRWTNARLGRADGWWDRLVRWVAGH